jgi:hypothetical protein
MKLGIVALFLSSLFVAASAHTAENWQSLTFTTTAQNLPKVIAATEKFMATEAGKAMPGTLSIMASVIDGDDPTTNSFITSTESMATREKWIASLEGNADWIDLRDTVASLAELGATSRMVFVKHWGERGDKNVVWHLFALTVSDSAAYTKAMDTLMASATGKKFPGSLHLSSVAAAGMSPVTHVLSVGYESEAEAETWTATILASADWTAFQRATDPISDRDGSWVLRTLKTWGAPPTTP